jgi:hypothetical protein
MKHVKSGGSRRGEGGSCHCISAETLLTLGRMHCGGHSDDTGKAELERCVLRNVQTGSGTYLASYSMGTASLFFSEG